MKIIKALSNVIRLWRQSHFEGDWMTSASSFHLSYGSANKWQPSCRGYAAVTLPFTLCTLMPFVPRIPSPVSCHLRQQWFPQPAASEHEAPLALRSPAAMCVPLPTGTSCSALCLTCLRTSSLASFPSCYLPPRVKNWNVQFSLKNFIRLRY